MENSKSKLKLIINIFSWIIIIFAACVMIFTIVTVSVFNRNDRSMFGYKFYIVKTDSMSLSENNKDLDVHFNAGDIVIIKKVKQFSVLEAGDIIAFLSTNSDSYGETITHMIKEVRYNDEGKLLGYVTYGTNTGTEDAALVTPEFVLGEYKGKLVTIGYIFAFLKTTPGYIVCILMPFALLIGFNGYKCVKLFRKYKGEQMESIKKEREELEKERKQAQEMMKELQALKEQLEKKNQEK